MMQDGGFAPLSQCCFTRIRNNAQPCIWHCAKCGCRGVWGCMGEKFFAHTCVPTIASNDYPNNRPNRMNIPRHYPNVVLHEYVIMPNHVHSIVQIVDVGGYGECMGEKYFAHTCVPSIANNDYPNNRPNRMKIPHHYPNVVLREYVIMPNHVHGIV